MKMKSETPGPGNYEPSTSYVKDKTVSYKMGSSSRTNLVSKDEQNKPGPGNYDNRHKSFGSDAKSFTF